MLAVDRRGLVGDAARVGFDEKAWRAIEIVARELNARSPDALARDMSRRAIATAKALGVRALDRLVSRVAGRRVDTAPLALPAEGAWMRRAVTGVDAGVAIATADVVRATESATPTTEIATVDAVPAPEPTTEIATVDAAAEPTTAQATPSAEPTTADAAPAADPEATTAPPTPRSAPDPATPDPATASNPPQLLQNSHVYARTSDAPAGLHAPLKNEPLPALPPRYGIDRVVLLAGESDWVFAYWETDPARIDASARAELRLLAEDGALVGRAYVDPTQGRQHLRVPARGRRYRAELVRLDGTVLSSSREVLVRAPETA